MVMRKGWRVVVGAIALAATALPAAGQTNSRDTRELSAQTARPRVTITPRPTTSPGPNAKRHCRAWLEQEHRVSGTVIVPKQQCWWQ